MGWNKGSSQSWALRRLARLGCAKPLWNLENGRSTECMLLNSYSTDHESRISIRAPCGKASGDPLRRRVGGDAVLPQRKPALTDYHVLDVGLLQRATPCRCTVLPPKRLHLGLDPGRA